MDFKKYMPIILGITGAAGTVTTAILAAKAAPKAKEKYEELKEKEEKPSFGMVVKEVVPCYIPTFVSGGLTIASILGSTVLSQKQQASLAATCLMLDRGWNRYREKVTAEIGPDYTRGIEAEIAKEDYERKPVEVKENEALYWERHIGFFKANPTKFAYATSDLNQALVLDDSYAKSFYTPTLRDLLRYADAKVVDPIKNEAELENIGWSIDYLSTYFEAVWIHVTLDWENLPDGKGYYKVDFFEEPIYDPELYDYDTNAWTEKHTDEKGVIIE